MWSWVLAPKPPAKSLESDVLQNSEFQLQKGHPVHMSDLLCVTHSSSYWEVPGILVMLLYLRRRNINDPKVGKRLSVTIRFCNQIFEESFQFWGAFWIPELQRRDCEAIVCD